MGIRNNVDGVLFDQTVSDTTPVTKTIPFAVREGISLQLLAGGTLDGAWKVEVSNNYSEGLLGRPIAGDWTDVTSRFTTIAAVAHGTATTQNQYATFDPLRCTGLRVTFTASAGSGRVMAAFEAGGNS